ncbi:MAG: PLP-dependent aminotransferase family protein [Saprospiraceae bacterium]
MILDLISINEADSKPIYLQISDGIILLLQRGVISAGAKLPASRILANHLSVHRQTCVAAYDELVAHGWLETKAGVGTFVASQMPLPSPRSWKDHSNQVLNAKTLVIPEFLDRNLRLTTENYHLDDGLPDPRLAPREELARAFKKILLGKSLYSKLQYADTKGQYLLRLTLCEYLCESRGMQGLEPDQILITRGVTQALFLFINAFVKCGDHVAVTALGWSSANVNFQHHGANLSYIRHDQYGMDVDHLEEICLSTKINAVYLTPHHHYPTTVIMPAHRRVQLLELSKKYGFYIFEDDYDFDFHYTSQPIMPLASSTHFDHVFYTGSFTKALAPAFRIGYLVASKNQIDLLAKFRRLVDRQGDPLMELAITELLKDGTIQRYLRKNRKIYMNRRDHFCNLMHDQLGDHISFVKPEGGMSVWTKFNKVKDFQQLVSSCSSIDLYIQEVHTINNESVNALRLGFASSDENELNKSVSKLKFVLENLNYM